MDVIDHGGGHWTINGDDIAGFLNDFTGASGGGGSGGNGGGNSWQNTNGGGGNEQNKNEKTRSTDELPPPTTGGDYWTKLGYVGIGVDITSGLSESYGAWQEARWQQILNSWRIGYTASTSKWTTFGRATGNLGLGIGIATFGYDVYQVSNGQISWGRFSYHLVGLGSSVYMGFQLGGPYGAAAGVGLGAAEIGYDHMVKPVGQELNIGLNSFIRGYFNTHFNVGW